jgi:2-haloacid dehalogenase
MAGDIGAVVFDLGGVLLDWSPFHLYRTIFADDAAIQAFLDETGLPALNLELDGGRPFAEGVGALATRFPHHAEALRAFDDRWLETVPGPIAESVALLERLDAAGVPLYALTNFSAEKFPHARVAFPFIERFRHVVVSGEVGLVKPDPRIFDVLLRWTGEPARRTVYIDDSMVNVTAARRLGFRALHFAGAARLQADLAALGLPV